MEDREPRFATSSTRQGFGETVEKGEREIGKELGTDDVSDNTKLESGSSNKTSSTRNDKGSDN